MSKNQNSNKVNSRSDLSNNAILSEPSAMKRVDMLYESLTNQIDTLDISDDTKQAMLNQVGLMQQAAFEASRQEDKTFKFLYEGAKEFNISVETMTKEILNFHADRANHAGLIDTRLNDILYSKYKPDMTMQERTRHLDNMMSKTKNPKTQQPTKVTSKGQVIKKVTRPKTRKRPTTLLSFL